MIQKAIIKILQEAIGNNVPIELTVPENETFGHYSTNLAMRLAGVRGEKPIEFAEKIVAQLKTDPKGIFEDIQVAPPGFINFWLSKKAIQEEFVRVSHDEKFGENDRGHKANVIVEYSAVNVAKTMNLGHFRTTIIGDALANLLERSQYKVVRWNYLGDWGTQFGKLITAYKLWGDKKIVEEQPIEELQKLYVKFHEEAKINPDLEKQGQEEFKKLEEGDKENRKLWEWFKKESLKEFKSMYALLGVDFDVWIGESFFEDVLKSTVQKLVDKKIAERSEGAMVIKLDQFNLPPALIEKSDGASLYLTRDIANLEYRLKKYEPAKILYVVANEQALHFEQLFAVAKLLQWNSAELTHVKYGLVLGEGGKKFSTREGRSVSMKQAIDKAITLARGIVEEKNKALSSKEKDEVARAVGIGALKFNDLKENRMTDIVFDWDKMLDFSGDSGPYLQYTYARLRSIMRKSEISEKKIMKADESEIHSEVALMLARKIFEFPDIVLRAGESYSTSTLATYLYKLAVAANKFYETTPILKDEHEARRLAHLKVIAVAARTLKEGLGILGIESPEKI